ncbi:MAG: hypothetical protein ACI9U2_000711, partial [Bradymonadia bacterium]
MDVPTNQRVMGGFSSFMCIKCAQAVRHGLCVTGYCCPVLIQLRT